MTTEAIIQIVISVFPSVLAIITTASLVLTVLRKFVELKKMVVDMKAVEELNTRLNQVLRENCELKKELREAMTRIDHIERK